MEYIFLFACSTSSASRYLPDLRRILLDLTDAVEGRTGARTVQPTTKIEPFQLTQPKARTVPIPKIVRRVDDGEKRGKSERTFCLDSENGEIPSGAEEHLRTVERTDGSGENARGESATSDAQTQSNACAEPRLHEDGQIVENAREISENCRRTREKSSVQPFSRVATAESAGRSRRFSSALENERCFQANPIPVKLNLAAVLKESQLYKKQEDDVRRRLMDYEAGGKDDQQFVQWQQTMQKQDYQEELNHIERKRLEGKLSYEEAILARQRLADENARLAEEIRRETRETVENLVKEKLKEEQRMK